MPIADVVFPSGTSDLFLTAAGGESSGHTIAVSAGTQIANSGTVRLANSNGVTFGMSGSSQITAS